MACSCTVPHDELPPRGRSSQCPHHVHAPRRARPSYPPSAASRPAQPCVLCRGMPAHPPMRRVQRCLTPTILALCVVCGTLLNPPACESTRASVFTNFFYNCIEAIDETHIHVVMPNDKVVQHVRRYGYTTQNVLAICNFDMRFTFVVARWLGSVRDMRVFTDALRKYKCKFPFSSQGK